MPVQRQISMHSGISFQAIESPIRPRSKAIRALSDPDLSTIGKQAAADLDEQHWAQESFKLSTSAVYNSEVTGHLRALAESGQSPQDVPLQLTEEYLKAGGAVSERRLVEAGFRLGAVLKQVAAGTQVKSSGPVASVRQKIQARVAIPKKSPSTSPKAVSPTTPTAAVICRRAKFRSRSARPKKSTRLVRSVIRRNELTKTSDMAAAALMFSLILKAT